MPAVIDESLFSSKPAPKRCGITFSFAPAAGENFLHCANRNTFFQDDFLGGIYFWPIKSGIFAHSLAPKFRLALPLLNAPQRGCAPASAGVRPDYIKKI